MTEKEPLPVLGYTSQSQANIDLVNENKVLEEQCLRQIDMMQGEKFNYDPRMIALARTKLQESFMWLNRAVFQPKRLDNIP